MWARNWGWTIARGVLAIIFGLIALFTPGITWVALMSFFAAYAFVDGIAALVAALSRRAPAERPWGMLLLEGILGIAVAVVWVIWPLRTSLAFLYVLGTWAVLGGILEIGSAIRLRRIIQHEWLLALAGLLSIAFGVIVFMRPPAAALALVWWIGSYAIVFGTVLIGVGIRMRRLAGPGRPRREVPVGAGVHRQQHT